MSGLEHQSSFYLVSCYFVLSIHAISAVILVCLIAHLLYIANQKQRDTNSTALTTFVILTIMGIVSFALSCLLVIHFITQLIIHVEVDDGQRFHFDMHWQYLIAIFDAIGHLCVVFVFVGKFQFTFKNGIFLTYSSTLIRCLYCILFLLFTTAFVIIALVVTYQKNAYIIGLEIVWQMLVEAMCLWMLYLFTSRFYLLLQLSLTDHIKSGKATDFFKELAQAVTHNNISKPTNEPVRTCTKGSQKHVLTVTKSSDVQLSIDGFLVQPVRASRSLDVRGIPTPKSVDDSLSPLPHVSLNALTVHSLSASSNVSIENELMHATTPKKQRKGKSVGKEEAKDVKIRKIEAQSHEAFYFIKTMNKLSVLVLLMVFVSIIGLVGTVFVEIRELERIEGQAIAVQSVWAEILPLMDIVITSFMLYLQFNFTDNVYRFILGKVDVLFLKCWLRLLVKCGWDPNKSNPNDKRLSFLYENGLQKDAMHKVNVSMNEIELS
eukprot:108258_1